MSSPFNQFRCSAFNDNDIAAADQPGMLCCQPDWTITGGMKVFQYGQFKDGIAYVAGHFCVYADVNFKSFTNDKVGGSALTGLPYAGVAQRVMSQNYYGWVQRTGRATGLLSDGATEPAAGAGIVVHATVDGAADEMNDLVATPTAAQIESAFLRFCGYARTIGSGSLFDANLMTHMTF